MSVPHFMTVHLLRYFTLEQSIGLMDWQAGWVTKRHRHPLKKKGGKNKRSVVLEPKTFSHTQTQTGNLGITG